MGGALVITGVIGELSDNVNGNPHEGIAAARM
jgi:hypothetical protein